MTCYLGDSRRENVALIADTNKEILKRATDNDAACQATGRRRLWQNVDVGPFNGPLRDGGLYAEAVPGKVWALVARPRQHPCRTYFAGAPIRLSCICA